MNLFVIYRWFSVVPQGLDVLFTFVLFGDFRSLFLVIFLDRFHGLSLWDLVGNVCMNSSWFFSLWFLSQIREQRGSILGVFGVLRLAEFLAGFLRFLLIQRVLVDHNLAMDCPLGVPTIPKVLFGSMERIGRSGVGFGEVDSRVLFISSYPIYTGLTDALDRSDRCDLFVGFALGELLVPCVFGLCYCWSVLGLFGVVLLGFV
jgi:hypothetical protein